MKITTKYFLSLCLLAAVGIAPGMAQAGSFPITYQCDALRLIEMWTPYGKSITITATDQEQAESEALKIIRGTNHYDSISIFCRPINQ